MTTDIYREPTCYVAVLGEGNRFINGTKRFVRKQYQLRDLSKLKWAPDRMGEENADLNSDLSLQDADKTKDKMKSLGFSRDDDVIYRFKRKDGLEDTSPVHSDDELYDGEHETHDLTVEELLDSLANLPFNRKSFLQYSANGELLDPQARKSIFQNLSEKEKQKLVQWMAGVRNLILSHEELQNLKYTNEMYQFCDLIFGQMKTPLSKFAHCIVGPRYSGKSTFLAVLVSKIAERLSQNGQWKKVFFFYISFRTCSENLKSLYGIYEVFIRAIFEQARLQIPSFASYAEKCISFFLGIPANTSSTSFPKRIAIDKVFPYSDIRFSKIGEKIRKLFADESKVLETIDFIFNLPKQIANIFNLTDVTYVIDDFDESDVDLFCKINGKDEHIILIERFKNLLPSYSYILGCLDLPHFLNILDSIKQESRDMKTDVQIINISDLPIKKPESKIEILVEYDNHKTFLRINRDFCHGCIGLLVGWDKLVNLARIVENNHMLLAKVHTKKSKKPIFTSDDYRVIDYAKMYLPKLFSNKDLPQSKIYNVTLVEPSRLRS